LKIGVIGGGAIGGTHLAALSNISGAEVVLCEIDDERRKSAGERFNVETVKEYKTLLASDVEFIDICLPTHLHEEFTTRAAEAGKHVFCEKPLSNTVESAEKMISVCNENDVKLGVGMVVRFFPEYARLKDKYDQGVIGEAGVINAYRGGGGFPRGKDDWYADEEISGFIPVDLMLHDIDFIQWVFGPVLSVYATKTVSAKGSENRYAVYSSLLKLESGTLVLLDGSWYNESQFHTRFEAAGDRGIMILGPEMTTPMKTTVFENESSGSDVAVPESPLKKSPYQHELEDFIGAIKEDREPQVKAEESLSALRVAIALKESAGKGKKIEIRDGE